MTAAIYARKSNDQGGIRDEDRSVARQVDHAQAYATRKGWHVSQRHIFVDDGVSGAEFSGRPGFVRLMSSLRPRPQFDVLIMSEESRLGRETIETSYALKQLIASGVRVFFYLEDRERTLDGPMDKLLMSVTAFADELEREKARQRTHDALSRKAKAGHVTGGRVFGYDNVDVPGHDGQRSHVERRVNQSEASVVRRIFEMCAAGAGLTRIAKALNAEGAVTPRAQQGRPRAWAPSSVREILLRRLYRGEIVWNQTRKRDAWGQQRQRPRPAADVVHVAAPALRLVPDRLWHAAHRELDARRARCAMAGSPRPDRESRHLLAGFGRCASCGGSMAAHTRSHGGRRVAFLGCLAYWKKGRVACSNGLAVPIAQVDDEVLETLRVDILRPAVVERAIRIALEALAPGGAAGGERAAAALEVQALELECQRLAEAVARGGNLEALLNALRDRQGKLQSARANLQALAPVSVRSFNPAAMERALRRRLDDWKGLLARDVASGREVLRTLLAGPLTFTAVQDERRRGYRFEGAVAFDRMIAGLVDLPTGMASPTGFEPVF